MTDQRISELGAATLPLAGTEQVPIVQGGVTRRVSASKFASNFGGYDNDTFISIIRNGGNTPVENNRMIFTPFRIECPSELNQIAIISANTPGTSESWAAAIYQTSNSQLPVGAPIYGGAAYTPTYNFVRTGYTGLSIPMPRGLYWLAFCGGGGGQYVHGLPADVQQMMRTVIGGNSDGRGGWGADSFMVPSISAQTPGTWPTLTGQWPDFDVFSRDFNCTPVNLRLS